MNNSNIRFLEQLTKCLPEEKRDEFTILCKQAYLKYETVRKIEAAKKKLEKLQAQIDKED